MVDSSEKQENKKPVSIIQLYKFASLKDKFLLAIAFLCAIIYGVRLFAMNLAICTLLTTFTVFNSELSLDEQISKQNNSVNHTSQTMTMSSATIIIVNSLHEFSISIVIIAITVWTSNYGMMITLDYTSQKQTIRCQKAYVKSLMCQDISWFDNIQSGKLISQTADDFAKFREGIGFKMGHFISCISGYILPAIYCLVINWKLTLVSFCFSTLYVLSYKILTISKMIYLKKECNAHAKAGSSAEEVLTAIKTVVSFRTEEKECQRYANLLKNGTKAGFYKGIMAAIAMSIFYFAFCSSYCVGTYYGLYQYSSEMDINKNHVNEFPIIVIIIVMTLCGFRLNEAFSHIDAISYARTSAARLFAIIQQVPTINPCNHNGITLEKIETIAFRNVSFSFPNRNVKTLDGLSFNVKSGETIAIVGESGSGKTTVTSLLQRFYDVSDGDILINDINIRNLSPTWIRGKIGHVIQEPVLFPVTIAENISYGKIGASNLEIEHAAKQANAHNFIQRLPLKYDTFVGDRGAQLSGGQKQRVAIARALIRNPEILLLDEATSALDTQSETLVQSALEKATEKKTTIVVAHRLSTIRNADRIIVLSLGKIVEVGNHDQLMNQKGIYYNFAINQVEQLGLSKKCFELLKCDSEANIIPEKTEIDTNPDAKKSYQNPKISEDIKKRRKEIFLFFRLFQLGFLESLCLTFGIFGSIIFGVTNTFLGLESVAQLSAIFSQRLLKFERQEAFNEYVIFLSISCSLYIFSITLQIALLGIAGSLLQKKLRQQMFSSFMSQDMAFFDNSANAVGSLCLNLSLDTENLKNVVCGELGIVLNVISQIVASVAVTFVLGWELGIIQLGLLIIGISACFLLQVMVRKQQKETAEKLLESNEVLRQATMNIRTVISLGLEKIFRKKLLSYYHKTTDKKCSEHIITTLKVFIDASAYIGLLLVAISAIPTILQGELVIISLFRVLLIMLRNNNTIRSVSAIPKFISANNSMQRIFDIIDKTVPEKFTDFQNGNSDIVEEKFIQLKDIQFSYPYLENELVLKGLNLNVRRGQIVALVGESGSGKSTCIQLLEQFYTPQFGSVMLSGKNIINFGKNARKQMALVQQEPVLFNRTIFENIAYGCKDSNISMEDVVEAAKIADAHDFITKLPKGYNTHVGERGLQISGGQKQRIAIARAILTKCEILFLDEATSALDTDTEKNVQRNLQEYECGKTIIIVAHRLSTIIDADIIYVISKGKVVEAGNHSELLSLRAHYYNLHKL